MMTILMMMMVANPHGNRATTKTRHAYPPPTQQQQVRKTHTPHLHNAADNSTHPVTPNIHIICTAAFWAQCLFVTGVPAMRAARPTTRRPPDPRRAAPAPSRRASPPPGRRPPVPLAPPPRASPPQDPRRRPSRRASPRRRSRSRSRTPGSTTPPPAVAPPVAPPALIKPPGPSYSDDDYEPTVVAWSPVTDDSDCDAAWPPPSTQSGSTLLNAPPKSVQPTPPASTTTPTLPFPPIPPLIPIEARDILTIHADEGPLTPDALTNVLKRVRERASIVNYFLDNNGWLWVRVSTEKQASRCLLRLSGIAVNHGTHTLRCQQTQFSAWPPNMLTTALAPAPIKAAPPHRPYNKTWKGGQRHATASRARAAAQSKAHVSASSTSSRPDGSSEARLAGLYRWDVAQ